MYVNKLFAGMLIALVFAVMGSIALNGQQQASVPARIRWEYSVYAFGDRKQQIEQFNSMGQQGWEYVGHQPSPNQATGYAIFKRPLLNQ